MDRKKLRKWLLAIKKRMDLITEIDTGCDIQWIEIIEQIKAERIII